MSIFKKKVDPHKESLERRIASNEAYLETMVAGTEEYKMCQEALLRDYEELRTMNEHKVKASDVLAWVTLGVTAVAGIFVPLYGMNHAYQKEEVEGELSNGKVWSLGTKNMKH